MLRLRHVLLLALPCVMGVSHAAESGLALPGLQHAAVEKWRLSQRPLQVWAPDRRVAVAMLGAESPDRRHRWWLQAHRTELISSVSQQYRVGYVRRLLAGPRPLTVSAGLSVNPGQVRQLDTRLGYQLGLGESPLRFGLSAGWMWREPRRGASRDGLISQASLRYPVGPRLTLVGAHKPGDALGPAATRAAVLYRSAWGPVHVSANDRRAYNIIARLQW